MTTIKKQYTEIFELLQANQNRKVSTLMPELVALMQAKSGGSDIGKTFLKDEEGNTYAVFCYYHKRWELVGDNAIAYGAKANTATGLNTMCKEGVSNWSKQQRLYKKAKDALLEQVADQTITADELPAKLNELEEERKAIVAHSLEAEFTYETAEELQASLDS